MDGALAWRGEGKEGRARVCARRAAGFALTASLGVPGRPNAYQMLRQAAGLPGWSEVAGRAAARLCARVTETHRLPHVEDPLENARLIVGELGFALRSRADQVVRGKPDTSQPAVGAH